MTNRRSKQPPTTNIQQNLPAHNNQQDLKCHASELVAKPSKYLDGVIFSKKSETVLHFNLRTGRLSPLTSDGVPKLKEATTDSSSDEILCITRFDFQLICYEPETNTVLSYERTPSFNISIVSRNGGRLHEKNDVPARMGQTFIKPGTIGKISWSDRKLGEGGKNTVLVEGEYQQRAVIVCIEKGQSDDDVVKKEVNDLSDVCNANHNFLKVYGMESDHDFHYVATEYCDTSLRDFIPSLRNPESQHLKDKLKLIREIVTAVACLHSHGISHGNLHLKSIFVDKYFRAKISFIGSRIKGYANFADDMLALGYIIFFCLTGVEYKGEDLTKLRSEKCLKPIYDCPDALDLLRKLLVKDPAQRATALQASNHTLFWSPSKFLQFIRAVTERLELKGPKLLRAIESIKEAVLPKNWDTDLPKDFLAVMNDGSYGDVTEDGSYKKHSYRYDSVYDLLRIIRNLQAHETRIKGQLSKRKLLDSKVCEMFGPAGFGSYFRKTFPNLVNEVYNVMKKHLGGEANFLEYYKQSPL